jgi:hypothetical protein
VVKIGCGSRLAAGAATLRTEVPEADQALAMQVLEAVSDRPVEAAIFAAEQVDRSNQDVAAALERDLEGSRYDAARYA